MTARGCAQRARLRKAFACLEAAAALGYLPEVSGERRDSFDRVLATLVRLVGGH